MSKTLKVFLVGIDKEYILDKLKLEANITILNNIDEIVNYKGDLLIINLDNIKDLYDNVSFYDQLKYEKYDLYEYDRLNRKRFSNFGRVIIVSLDLFFDKYNYKNIYSNISFVNDVIDVDVENIYNNSIKKVSNIKNNNILKLKSYVDNKKNYFNSIDIINTFKVSNRWVKRYMKDMNDIYNNIGYSYSKRMWYKVDER